MAAYAAGAARLPLAPEATLACPAGARGDSGSGQPPEPEYAAPSHRAQPLALPAEDDQTWLQEWLDLISAPTKKVGYGC